MMKKTKNFSKEPFFNFYPAEDICKCKNDKCKQCTKCFRFMGASTEWQSMSTFEGGKKCKNFMPYIVWKSGDGQFFTLDEINNDYLKNIIIHLLERSVLTTESLEENMSSDIYLKQLEYARKSVQIAKEFIKEARKRKIYY